MNRKNTNLNACHGKTTCKCSTDSKVRKQHTQRLQDSVISASSCPAQHGDVNDLDVDGRIHNNVKDPPGQRSVYILPGDPEKESYRLSTFIKFPQEVGEIMDVRTLAAYGFLYTGYKDRLKCFSCGANVHEWVIGDDPKEAKWHLNGCPLVLGTDTTNKPIIPRPLQFKGTFVSSLPSRDSGFGSMEPQLRSSSSFENGTSHPTSVRGDDRLAETRSNPGVRQLSQNLNLVQIGNNNTMSVGANSSTHQTARVVETKRSPSHHVQGLDMANIQSPEHKTLLTVTLNLHKEEDRRKSFDIWLQSYVTVTPNALAKSGFFFLGNADRVQCFSCSGVLRNWRPTDDVQFEHRRHFPRCRMVRKIEIRNIPLIAPLDDVNSANGTLVEPPDPSPEEMENLKQQFPCLYPVNPHMRNLEARLQTFDERWPMQRITATVEHISKAGFFYLGN